MDAVLEYLNENHHEQLKKLLEQMKKFNAPEPVNEYLKKHLDIDEDSARHYFWRYYYEYLSGSKHKEINVRVKKNIKKRVLKSFSQTNPKNVHKSKFLNSFDKKNSFRHMTGSYFKKNKWDNLFNGFSKFKPFVVLNSGLSLNFKPRNSGRDVLSEPDYEQLYLQVYDEESMKWGVPIKLSIYAETSSLSDYFRIDSNNVLFISGTTFQGEQAEATLLINSNDELDFLKTLMKQIQEDIDKGFERSRKIVENAKSKQTAFTLKRDSFLTEFDKDGNGVADVIEGADDFLTLFKKHQKAIIEVDKDYIQKFVKISNYLKTKRRNIQSIFENFNQADTHEDLENRVGILKNDIHTYEVLLMHSLNMIMTLVNEDMITFYEIYESFDKLNVFNSNWENEVSDKLSDIGDGLNQLIYSVNKMNQDIVQELSYLSYTTETSFQELQSSVSAELSSINSSIQFGNLLSGIQTYQLHKINKRGDNLLKR